MRMQRIVASGAVLYSIHRDGMWGNAKGGCYFVRGMGERVEQETHPVSWGGLRPFEPGSWGAGFLPEY